MQGSYSCRCFEGFIGNGHSCSDLNECLTNNGGCDKNAQCVNTDGSFKVGCDVIEVFMLLNSAQKLRKSYQK